MNQWNLADLLEESLFRWKLRPVLEMAVTLQILCLQVLASNLLPHKHNVKNLLDSSKL